MKFNIVGPINSMSYGYVTQNLIKALIKNGHQVNLQCIGPYEPDEMAGYNHFTKLCGKELDDSPTIIIWHHFELKKFKNQKSILNIGFPIFEVNYFVKGEIEQLESMDLLFATSQWYRNIIRKFVPDKAIHVVNLGVDTDIFHSKQRIHTNPRGPISFLTIGKWEIRKGHLELIKTFAQEFTPQDNYSITFACDNPFIHDDNLRWRDIVYKYLGSKANILPIRLQSSKDVAQLINEHNAYVTLSKAEGWNLPLCEALAMNKPCIATNYSAHTEFCTKDNCCLVDITEEELCFDGQFFYGQGSWAKITEIEIRQTRKYLRYIYNALKQGLTNSTESNKFPFSWNNSVSQILKIFERRS